MRKVLRKTIFLLVLSLVAAGALAAAAERGNRVAVSISGRQFAPAVVTVNAGDVVVWTNNDDLDHVVAADDGSFASGKIKSGKSFQYRFTRAGTYLYSCSLHPREKARVVVRKP